MTFIQKDKEFVDQSPLFKDQLHPFDRRLTGVAMLLGKLDVFYFFAGAAEELRASFELFSFHVFYGACFFMII